MKPKIIELIPGIGLFFYLIRYFRAKKRSFEDAKMAYKILNYHIFASLIIILIITKLILC